MSIKITKSPNDTFVLSDDIEFKGLVTDRNRNPINLVGAVFYFALSRSLEEDPVLTLNSEEHDNFVLGNTGEYIFWIRSENTEELPAGTYRAEIRIKFNDGKIKTHVRDVMTFVKPVEWRK